MSKSLMITLFSLIAIVILAYAGAKIVPALSSGSANTSSSLTQESSRAVDSADAFSAQLQPPSRGDAEKIAAATSAEFEQATRSAAQSAAMQANTDSQVPNIDSIYLQGSGKVIKVLPDTTREDAQARQQFIIVMPSSQQVRVLHNIDLAPRIAGLKSGDAIEFFGQYEWNAKGGVLDRTHHDPQQQTADGWITHNGKLYK